MEQREKKQLKILTDGSVTGSGSRVGSDSTLKIAGRIFDPKRRIPVGRGREKAGRAKTSQLHAQAVREVDTESWMDHAEVPILRFLQALGETSRLGVQSAAGNPRRLPFQQPLAPQQVNTLLLAL